MIKHCFNHVFNRLYRCCLFVYILNINCVFLMCMNEFLCVVFFNRMNFIFFALFSVISIDSEPGSFMSLSSDSLSKICVVLLLRWTRFSFGSVIVGVSTSSSSFLLLLFFFKYKFLECSSFSSCCFRCHGVAVVVLVVFLLVGNVIFGIFACTIALSVVFMCVDVFVLIK